MPAPNLVVDIPKITTMGQQAKDVESMVSSLPSKYPVSVAPLFGDTVSNAFQDARTLHNKYADMVKFFVDIGQGSNLKDYIDQLQLLQKGAGDIATDYHNQVLTESNAADRFKQAMGAGSTGA